MKRMFVILILFGFLVGVIGLPIGYADRIRTETAFPNQGYSPYAGRDYPTRVFFGDLHLHTMLSPDARDLGNTLDDEKAYRFARGEEVVSSTGQRVRLSRPLDFLVVADHAEAYGMIGEVAAGNPILLTDPTVRRWHEMLKEGGKAGDKAAMQMIIAIASGQVPAVMINPEVIRSIWQKHLAVVERYNEPGRFTAFIGYEWSSTPRGDNLHRVVVFRDGAERAGQILPFSAFDSGDPEDLWKALDDYQRKTGGSVFAIPHNGNLSNGRMFAPEDFAGRPFTLEYAETRARWEPLVEVTQQKGDGETHPSLSPGDEFADYERWDKANLALSEMKRPEMLRYEYARSALKLGLELSSRLGADPFKFGMVGSTDSHTSLADVEEDNFFGAHSRLEPSSHRWEHAVLQFDHTTVPCWQLAASGYAAVWARENTREALWDAMKRRETYATTGARMVVRFFGGWDFNVKDTVDPNLAETGYAKGVPMGGDLHSPPRGKKVKVPTFLVAAFKDPIGANLDRVQIIKGWLDRKGRSQEKVYNVACSGGRKPDAKGTIPPVGTTVDVAKAIWTNSIGAPELIAVWKDPEFNPSSPAFYYVRVIEIPTPRWTAYDVKRFGVKMPSTVPMVTTERAYTSPIWYTPEK